MFRRLFDNKSQARSQQTQVDSGPPDWRQSLAGFLDRQVQHDRKQLSLKEQRQEEFSTFIEHIARPVLLDLQERFLQGDRVLRWTIKWLGGDSAFREIKVVFYKGSQVEYVFRLLHNAGLDQTSLECWKPRSSGSDILERASCGCGSYGFRAMTRNDLAACIVNGYRQARSPYVP